MRIPSCLVYTRRSQKSISVNDRFQRAHGRLKSSGLRRLFDWQIDIDVSEEYTVPHLVVHFSENRFKMSGRNFDFHNVTRDIYRGADKSLARPERKQATATEDFDVHMSYL